MNKAAAAFCIFVLTCGFFLGIIVRATFEKKPEPETKLIEVPKPIIVPLPNCHQSHDPMHPWPPTMPDPFGKHDDEEIDL